MHAHTRLFLNYRMTPMLCSHCSLCGLNSSATTTQKRSYLLQTTLCFFFQSCQQLTTHPKLGNTMLEAMPFETLHLKPP